MNSLLTFGEGLRAKKKKKKSAQQQSTGEMLKARIQQAEVCQSGTEKAKQGRESAPPSRPQSRV